MVDNSSKVAKFIKYREKCDRRKKNILKIFAIFITILIRDATLKEIIGNIYYVGDSGCSVYLVDTRSVDGMVLIDAGMDLEFIKNIHSYVISN